MIPPPRNLLISFHYFKTYDVDRLGNACRIIGDSGAFSAASQGAAINLPDLCKWGQQWKHRLAWIASLDVIGDPKATTRNWNRMVHEFDLPAVPTLHYGADPTEMDYYVAQGVDFMGLGGVVGLGAKRKARNRWLIHTMRYARKHHPQVRFHGWGMTDADALQLPFWSVDSSGWGSAYRYGRIKLRDPRTRQKVEVMLDGKAAYEPAKAKLFRDVYGVSPAEVAKCGPANRELLVKLSALSVSVLEQEFRQAPISTSRRAAPPTSKSYPS